MLEKILVVSNSQKDRDTIKNTLSDKEVLFADNIYDALKYLDNSSNIKLAFLDIDLPEMSGYHLLAIMKMRNRYESIRLIIMSENNEFADIMRSSEFGKVDYLHKPIDSDSLRIISRMQSEISDQSALVKKMSADNFIFNLLFNEAPFGIAITRVAKNSKNHETISMSVNEAYERITGRKQSEFADVDWRAITHPDDLAVSEMFFSRILAGEIKSYSREKRYVRPDGTIVWVSAIVSEIDTKDENVFSHLSLIQDITDRKKIEQELIESERNKSVLLSHLPGLAYRCKYDRNWTMMYVSKGSLELTGYEAESLMNNRDLSYNDLIAPPYRDLLWKEWQKVIKLKTKFRYAYQIITENGEWKWVYELGEPIFDQNGNVEALEGIVIDMSAQKKLESALQYKTDHDSLTDLYNRNCLERVLSLDLKKISFQKRALVVVNLNPIQSLALVHGYHYSQDLMQSIATKLGTLVNKDRTLFLIHENSLAYYVRGYDSKDDLIVLYEQIAAVLDSTIVMERISCGVGIIEIPANAKTSQVDTILKNVLLASEKAYVNDEKAIHYVFFDAEMDKAIIRENEIHQELIDIANGVEPERLFLNYQPIIDLKTGRVSGFEALARLKNADLGTIPPLDFIPLLEKTKLIIPLGEKIIRTALNFLKRVHEAGYVDVSMSVNISAVQLVDGGFTDKFASIINELKVNPNKIWVELTESVFATNYQEINAILAHLSKHGVRIAIDDFGTGFSSLHRLMAISINGIKIDKAFLTGIEKINIDEAITKDIISLGQKLHYLVVAEGIENEIQKDYLVHYGCDRGQGYYFSRPLGDDDALAFVKKNEKKTKA